MEKKGAIAVSNVIGTMLMLALAITLIVPVSLTVMNYDLGGVSISPEIIGFIEGDNVILEHHGGKSLDSNEFVGIKINGTLHTVDITENLVDVNSNGLWDIGEWLVYAQEITGLEVQAIITESDTNTLIFHGILQEGDSESGGPGSTPPSLVTFIDSIGLYEQSLSPLSLTATGDANLDNVTLYYRYNTNNWSDSWSILTYDDFEEGFGNYTDGGYDCNYYTDGTYAHQGTDAINIEDNSGTASSFYHTSGIDVDTPGYTSITVDFWFYSVSMFPNRDFRVQYYDGNDWNTVADYDYGSDFVDGQFYHKIIWINETEHTFPSDMKIRFMCSAENDEDDIYIDEVYVNASTSSVVTIFSTSFEDGDEVSNWELDDERTTASSGYTLERENDGSIGPRTGSYYLGGTDNFDPEYAAYNRTIDISGYTNVSLSVWYSFEDTESSDEFGFYYWDGVDWVEIFEDLSPDTDDQEDWTNSVTEIDENIDTLILQFWWSTSSNSEHVMIDDLLITGEAESGESDWQIWTGLNNPDSTSPWEWSFDFPNDSGYYEFYSIGKYDGDAEPAPDIADVICYYNP